MILRLPAKYGTDIIRIGFAASFFSVFATFLGYVGYAYAWGPALWIFLAIFGGSTLGFIVIAKVCVTVTLRVNFIITGLAGRNV